MEIFKKISVEPIMFLYLLASMMNILTTQNLNLEKACRVDLQYNSSICDAMVTRNKSGYDPEQEAEVQKMVSNMVAVKNLFVGFFPVILMLFLGAWSDRYSRRKPIILLPICGDLIGCICLFLCSFFFLELPVIFPTLAEAIPTSIGGGWSCAFLGAYSYLSGLCNDDEKTTRIGTLTMIQAIAITFGKGLAGVLIKPCGYQNVYLISATLMLSAIIYGYFMIEDGGKVEERVGKKKGFLQDFFDVEHVKNTFKTCFKDGPRNRKFKMVVLMMTTMMLMGSSAGEYGVSYLYTRIKFGWNEVNFSGYITLNFFIQLCGSAVALLLFTRYLKMHDALLGVIALASQIFGALVYALAPTGRIFCIGAFVEIFHETSHIAMRSLMNKIVPAHELGQSNSVFNACEAMVPIFFVPFYTTFYNLTISKFPGAFYLLSALLKGVILYLFFWLYRADTRDCKLEKNCEEEMERAENLLEKPSGNIVKNMDRTLEVYS